MSEISEAAFKLAHELVHAEPTDKDFVGVPFEESRGYPGFIATARYIQTTSDTITRACRMIEEGNEGDAVAELEELVLSKPDPLVATIKDIQQVNTLLSDEKIAERIREGLAKRGFKIVPEDQSC